MDTTKYIQTLAKIELALFVIYIFATLWLESSLPQELQNYLALERESEFTPTDGIVILVLLPLVIIHLASLIGFIRTKLWAAKYFIYSTIGLFICAFFLGPLVDHAIASVIDDSSVLVIGAIMAMLYTTDSAFNKARNPMATTPDR